MSTSMGLGCGELAEAPRGGVSERCRLKGLMIALCSSKTIRPYTEQKQAAQLSSRYTHLVRLKGLGVLSRSSAGASSRALGACCCASGRAGVLTGSGPCASESAVEG